MKAVKRKKAGRPPVKEEEKRVMISVRVLLETESIADRLRKLIPPDKNKANNAKDGLASYGKLFDVLVKEFWNALSQKERDAL